MSTRDTAPAGRLPESPTEQAPTPHLPAALEKSGARVFPMGVWGKMGVGHTVGWVGERGGLAHLAWRQAGARCIGATACSRDGGGNNPQRPSKKRTFFFSQGTLQRGEKRKKTQRRRARAHPSPTTWKWPTLLHLYTPRHACSICIYIMYIRMLYYSTTVTSHFFCNTRKRRGRGKGGWGGGQPKKKKIHLPP